MVEVSTPGAKFVQVSETLDVLSMVWYYVSWLLRLFKTRDADLFYGQPIEALYGEVA